MKMHVHRLPYLPPEEPAPESHLATWLVGGAALLVWFYLIFFVLVPALS